MDPAHLTGKAAAMAALISNDCSMTSLSPLSSTTNESVIEPEEEYSPGNNYAITPKRPQTEIRKPVYPPTEASYPYDEMKHEHDPYHSLRYPATPTGKGPEVSHHVDNYKPLEATVPSFTSSPYDPEDFKPIVETRDSNDSHEPSPTVRTTG